MWRGDSARLSPVSPVACQDRVIWINESSRNQKLIPLGTLVAASCASSFPANRLPRSPAVPEKVTGSGKQTCFSPWKGSPRSRGLVEFVSPFSYPQDLSSQVTFRIVMVATSKISQSQCWMFSVRQSSNQLAGTEPFASSAQRNGRSRRMRFRASGSL